MHVDQCDSAFWALQLTALIISNWCVLVYCCACLHPNTILMEAGWTTVPCPATNVSILIQYVKSSARIKQSVINVALKTPLEIRLGICLNKTSLLHRPDDYIGFTPSWPPAFYIKIAPMFTWIQICAGLTSTSGVQRGARGRTGRRPRESKTGGHPKSEITNI